VALLCVGGAALALPAAASAFGTIDGHMGQHAEHEKITRVLGCTAVDRPDRCFEPLSLDMLAGAKNTLGGVGIPDSPLEILNNPQNHCDDADYLPGLPYKRSDADRAVDALRACAVQFNANLRIAVDQAGDMLDANGNLRPGQIQVAVPTCTPGTGTAGGRAKCNTLEYLGRALHAAEDFWSHTNWGDKADPDKPIILKQPKTPAAAQRADTPTTTTPTTTTPTTTTPTTTTPTTTTPTTTTPATTPPVVVDEDATYSLVNPAGLGHAATDLVPWMRYPVNLGLLPTVADMRAGTAPISGCDDSADSVGAWIFMLTGAKTSLYNACPSRVGHSWLNKDKGLIDPDTGKAESPSTPRGQIGNNFQNVVSGARNQAKAVWGDFATAVLAKYPGERGELILRALVTDTPWTTCKVGGGASFAKAAPTGPETSLRSVTATIQNRTGETLTCGSADLTTGQWASLPPDTLAANADVQFRIESIAQQTIATTGAIKGPGGPSGAVTMAIGQTGYGIRYGWDNPIVGSNSNACTVERDGATVTSAPYRCVITGGKGNQATPVILVTKA
jgi:cell division septation protein DedD